MGNCVSASLQEIAPKIRVVQAVEGRVVDIELPVSQASMKVGELMLEFPPGHFVAQLDIKADIRATTARRAAPLGADADADAKPGAAYVLFPMPRLHTRIAPQELLTFSKLLHLHDQHFAIKAASLKPQVHSRFTAGARVAPLSEEDSQDGNLSGGDNTEQVEPETIYSSSTFVRPCHDQIQVIKCKPWAPKLETIQESSG